MNPNRCIMHADMDAFYASIEQKDNPSLAEKLGKLVFHVKAAELKEKLVFSQEKLAS